MNIKLYIEENNYIKLCLVSGKKEVDRVEWQDENSMSRFLLANLDKLLRKNGVGLDPVRNSKKKASKQRYPQKISNGVDKISGWQIMSEVPQKWTTYRIADIALKTLKIGQNSR